MQCKSCTCTPHFNNCYNNNKTEETYVINIICKSKHLNQTKEDRNVTENSFKIDNYSNQSQEMHLEAEKVLNLKDLRCSNENIIFADGFADLFSGVALPDFTNKLKRNSAKHFTRPNRF